MDLYLVLWERDAEKGMQADGEIAARYTGRSDYIGLRETQAGAIERARVFFPVVAPETHCMLKFMFTPEGIAHYTVNCTGKDYGFASILHKRYCWETPDHGTWHFHGNIPTQKVTKRTLDGTPVPLVTAVKLPLFGGLPLSGAT